MFSPRVVKEVGLEPVGESATSGAGDKTVTSGYAHFDAKDAGTAVPFKFYDHLPQVTGSVDGVPALFDIDSGSCSEIDLTRPFVARHQLREKYVKGVSAITGWGVGGPSRSYVARLRSLTFGGMKVDDDDDGLSEAFRR